jgi:uncharacterized protein (UPF0276 family)
MLKGWQAGPVPHRAGVGLRGVHHADWLQERPVSGWLEAHAENYFAAGGPLPALLETLRQNYPLALHGVGLGLGSIDPLDSDHLAKLKELVARVEPQCVSEHLCWGSAGGEHFNDLLPLPYTEESLRHLTARVQQLQDTLGRVVLIENLASYVTFAATTLAEAEFIAELSTRSGCGILLDLNNLYVNAHNHGIDAQEYLAALPAAAIGEIHLAGHTAVQLGADTVLIDDHGSAVPEPVWDLYRLACRRFGPRPTLIEWDTDVPPLAVLLEQAARADREAQNTEAP